MKKASLISVIAGMLAVMGLIFSILRLRRKPKFNPYQGY